ncbi:MAG: GNAT family N-acetyltransferase [Saccharofermentanales bacterium]
MPKSKQESEQSKYNRFSIRKAVPSDADDMAYIICESWKSAYKDIITPEELERKTDIEKRKALFRETIPAGKGYYLIAFTDDVPCGLCYFCDSRDDDMAGFAEIVAFYTLEEYWGRGIGKKIMDSALSEISRLGYNNVMLWVFEKNARARKFYEKCGFVCDNKTKDSIFGKVKEIRYVRG